MIRRRTVVSSCSATLQFHSTSLHRLPAGHSDEEMGNNAELGDGCYSLFVGANYPCCLDVRKYLEEKYEDDYIDEKECLEGICVYLSHTLDADVTLFEVKKGIYMYAFYYDPFRNLSYEKSKTIRQLSMWFRPTSAEVTS